MPDEFDIEAYGLKPVNKGLGFHERKRGRTASLHIPKTGLERRWERERSLDTPDSLKAFYDMPVAGAKKEVKKKAVSYRKAEDSLRFFGWLLDLLLVGLMSLGTIVGLGFFAYLFGRTSMEMIILTFSKTGGPMVMGALFAIVYLLYFTYGDIGSSFGKRFFGIKMVTKSGRPLDSKMTFVRSLATLFSLCLLGIPALFDFQGKLSRTKIIRE